MRHTFLIVITAILANCYAPDLSRVHYTCDEHNPFCPEGLNCVQGCCGGPPCASAPPPSGFTAGHAFPTGPNPARLAAADINADGKLDLVVANDGDGSISVLLGDGSGVFTSSNVPFVVAGARVMQVSLGDLNRDAKADLIIANSTGGILVRLGNGDGTFMAQQSFLVGAMPSWGAVADLDGDGKLDVAVANAMSNNVSVLIGDGLGGFKAAVHYPVGLGPSGLVVADSNGDGTLDLMTCDLAGLDVSALTNNGNGTFKGVQGFATNVAQNGIAVADFDGDKKADLITTNTQEGLLALLFGNGDANGSFRSRIGYIDAGPGSGPYGIAAADFNLDGRVDIATANSTSGTIGVLLGDGAGNFTAPVNIAVGGAPLFPVVGDFNGDGKPDLAVTNNANRSVYVLLNSGP